jgi:hypothetical protein
MFAQRARTAVAHLYCSPCAAAAKKRIPSQRHRRRSACSESQSKPRPKQIKLLLRLDPTDYRLAVESGEAELAAAKSSQAQAMPDDASRRTRSFPENECLAP